MANSNENEDDLSFKELYHLTCVISSCFFNALLSFLIIFKSPQQLGKYKHLMVFTAVFETLYAILDYFVRPLASSSGYSWFVIRLNNGMDPKISLLILLVWCGMFGVSQAIFAVHFIFRYAAINKTIYNKYVEGKKLIIMFITPILMGANDALVTWYCFAATNETNEYLKNYVWNYYSEAIESTSYICAKFYVDENGSLSPDFLVWTGVLNLWTMVLVSMFCVFNFGWKTYKIIRNQLEMLNVQSEASVALQQQLFMALVVQTGVPFLFMYIPCTILFSTAMFNVDVGNLGGLISYTITLYPVVDPLPTIFIIKSYRNAVKDFFINLLGLNGTTDGAEVPQPGNGSAVQKVSETVL